LTSSLVRWRSTRSVCHETRHQRDDRDLLLPRLGSHRRHQAIDALVREVPQKLALALITRVCCNVVGIPPLAVVDDEVGEPDNQPAAVFEHQRDGVGRHQVVGAWSCAHHRRPLPRRRLPERTTLRRLHVLRGRDAVVAAPDGVCQHIEAAPLAPHAVDNRFGLPWIRAITHHGNATTPSRADIVSGLLHRATTAQSIG
jgi:hypothetical protein